MRQIHFFPVLVLFPPVVLSAATAAPPATARPFHALLAAFLLLFLLFIILLALFLRIHRKWTAARILLETQAAFHAGTGLPNQTSFRRSLAVEVGRSDRYGVTFSLVLCNLDGLKMINDFFTRRAGDFIITETAQLMHPLIRDVDSMFYLENGTFALLLPSTGAAGARILAERLRQAVADLCREYEGREIAVCASFGVAEHARQAEDADALFTRAEDRLLEAKKTGRNRVC